MSEAIKKMLAERQAQEAKAQAVKAASDKDPLTPKNREAVDALFEVIDRAAPYMDEGCDPKAWKPSFKLKLIYWGISSSEEWTRAKQMMAYDTIDKLLQKSRDLWTAGCHPDPFRNADSPWSEA